MIKFSCAHCGKIFQFEKLPIPESGAKFQCSGCDKTCNLMRRGDSVFCFPDEDEAYRDTGTAAMVDFSDPYRSAREDEISPDELESRLQGLVPDLPYDHDLLLGILEGPDQGTMYPIRKPRISIGKSGCDINLNDARVSTEHCQLEIYSDRMTVIRDLQSTNGTYRNGIPTTLACLRPGDRIHVGNTTLQYIQVTKKISGS